MSEIPLDKLKLTLTRAALERLIGGEREMELFLTDAAVRQVVSKRLEAVKQEVRKAIENEIAIVFGHNEPSYRGPQFVLSPTVRQAINSNVVESVKERVKEYVQADASDLSKMIDEQIKGAVEMFVSGIINTKVRESLNKAVDAALTSVLKRQ